MIDIKSGKDEVEAPTYSHLVYDVVPDEKVVVAQPRHRDRRGPQRAPAGAGPRRRPHRAGGQRLLRLLGVRRRGDRRHPALVRRPVPAAARDRVPRPGVVLRPLRRRSPTTRRSPRPTGSGTTINGPNLKQNVQPTRGAGHAGAAQGPPTTRCAGSGSASSERGGQRRRRNSGTSATGSKPSRALIPIICSLTSAFWVDTSVMSGRSCCSHAQVGDLDRGAEPVPAVAPVHERAPLLGPHVPVGAHHQVAVRDRLAVADGDAAQPPCARHLVPGDVVPQRLHGVGLLLELQVTGRGVDRELVEQAAVGLQQLLGHVVDVRAHLVARGVRGHLGVDLVEQRVRDRSGQLADDLEVGRARTRARAANRSAGASSRSSNRYEAALITSVRPRPHVLDEPLDERAADAVAARVRLDAGNTNALSRLSSSDSQTMPPPTIRSPSKMPDRVLPAGPVTAHAGRRPSPRRTGRRSRVGRPPSRRASRSRGSGGAGRRRGRRSCRVCIRPPGGVRGTASRRRSRSRDVR